MEKPGWADWCQKEFIYKMYHEGKLEKPKYAGMAAKTRRNTNMYATKDRVFPDELDTRYDLGNFEHHRRSHLIETDPKREARKILTRKCRDLEKELNIEVSRTRKLEDELRRRTASAPASAIGAPLGDTFRSEAASSYIGRRFNPPPPFEDDE
mmetsp:Transcript_16980/g.47411  ORF Transcript_16980/g.47411 Transcript_16980/m.47411 type:complete len:153 (-) Transcript_16980:196-654(-)|eukprot:CAMPEP_0117669770 /NCGR_PEP_ID=MMETSP0804-20121206/12334_1 /TAXON_ID=1074897 /ORGANISM="Tetraselmis astigmatica, Strain CCMP880" /LENGTH=152 /DNA_ID=CAMNT_0005477899 /DNA_START=251 /DNA_END=709 /DNA_ORIENTATION=-